MKKKKPIRYYTTADVAKMAGVSRAWVHMLASSDRLPIDAVIESRDGRGRVYLFSFDTADSIAVDIKRQAGKSNRLWREYTGGGPGTRKKQRKK